MYAIAIVRFRKPIDQVDQFRDEHRTYLEELRRQGIVIASGPVEPRFLGAMLLRVPDDAVDATLFRVRDNDPYVREGLAQYELLPWNPVNGRDNLDRIPPV